MSVSDTASATIVPTTGSFAPPPPPAAPRVSDGRLLPIAERVMQGERLSPDEGRLLLDSADLLGVGWLANQVRERLHGGVTYFNVNRHINPTNVCVASCRLCAFGRRKNSPGAYTMALDEAYETAARGYSEAVTEFHIVGGLHPELTFDFFLDLIRGLKERFPNVHIKAFTMVEIGWFAKITRSSAAEVLERLREAGLDSMPGGGAEIFNERVRRVICDHKINGAQWLEIARTAHGLGLKSNATMLYGHIETNEDRLDHLLRLRELQDETGGFVTFIPLCFHPDNTPLAFIPRPSAALDLRMIAVSRLMLDNFPHIKAYWQTVTPAVAQLAQWFGADDIDGTVVEEKIYHDAGSTNDQALTRKDLMRLIRRAGREPVERDTRYRPVLRDENTFTIAV
jgi:aminodeoxyfutalosine synthase